MKTKTEILTEFYQSKELDETLKNLLRGNYQYLADWKQELFIILLEQPEEKIQKAYSERWLMYLAVRTTLNQIRSTTSPFYKKYRQNYESFDFDSLISENNYSEFDILKWCNENKVLSWYESEILSLYYKLGRFKHRDDKMTLRGIEEEYGIDHVSIYLTLKEALRKIKEEIGKDDLRI